MERAEQPSAAQRQQMAREGEEHERRQQERQIAGAAAQQGMADDQYAAPGYWDTISKTDFGFEDRPDDYFEDFIRIEGSKFNVLGNISYGDWQKFCWRIENELFARRNELQNNHDLDDADVAAMYGERLPRHTNERESRLKSAERALKMQLSLSMGARGLRSGTEIHAVARSEHGPEDDEPDGRLAKAKRWLTG